ncbi:hypothetical protein GQX74_006067, partial [Glossina fuscipes]
MFELIIFEIPSALESSSRHFYWRLGLTVLLLTVIVVISLHIFYSNIHSVTFVKCLKLHFFISLPFHAMPEKWARIITMNCWLASLYGPRRVRYPFPLLSASCHGRLVYSLPPRPVCIPIRSHTI